MQRSLDYGAMPPPWVPLPFLLTAPCFVFAAALLLAWCGEAALVSRWTPLTLAITHLLTLGFLTMTIAGALLQLLPVVAAVRIPSPRLVAGCTWAGLVAGTVLLASALGLGLGRPFFHAAAAALGLAASVFLAALGRALARKGAPAAAALVRGARLALCGLAVTVVLGGTLALYLAGSASVNAPLLTDVHAFWGLAGWVVALTVTVSFQVIPMFQGTSVYARVQEQGLPGLLFGLLLGWSAATLAGLPFWRTLAEAGIGVLLAGYAGITLTRFRKRRRKPNVGTYYWVFAMACLALAALVHFLPFDTDQRPLLVGILVIAGFGMSAINGMLYKIVPFLVWYHLQCDQNVARENVPNVKVILDETRALRQWRWHVVSLGLLIAAPLAPAVLARPAGIFQLFAALLMIRDLGGAVGRYLRVPRGAAT